MMYPKVKKTKRRKVHKASILHSKDGTCYLCMKLDQNSGKHKTLHDHHVFGGANRSISEAEGMKVYLCLRHHIDGPEAVHNNQRNMRIIQEDAQKVYELTHTREQFIERFGRNYLEDEEKQQGRKQEPTKLGFRFLEEDKWKH